MAELSSCNKTIVQLTYYYVSVIPKYVLWPFTEKVC